MDRYLSWEPETTYSTTNTLTHEFTRDFIPLIAEVDSMEGGFLATYDDAQIEACPFCGTIYVYIPSKLKFNFCSKCSNGW